MNRFASAARSLSSSASAADAASLCFFMLSKNEDRWISSKLLFKLQASLACFFLFLFELKNEIFSKQLLSGRLVFFVSHVFHNFFSSIEASSLWKNVTYFVCVPAIAIVTYTV